MKRLIKSFILCVLMTCILAPAFSASATVTYSKGKVEIDIQSSDNQDTQPIKPTQTIRVKVVIIAAENVT